VSLAGAFTVVATTVVATTVVCAREWRSALVPPLLVLLRSALLQRVLLPLWVAHTAIITIALTTAAYLRHDLPIGVIRGRKRLESYGRFRASASKIIALCF
jgi:hypothetical protein